MNWKKMTIGKKIGLGFGFVLMLLALSGLLSYSGVDGIVNYAKQVINGNILDGYLAQVEVDHLNWANKVNALLTDHNVSKLTVETDDQKCGFGLWLYGEGGTQAQKLVPSLTTMLKGIEKPHRQLHQSAIEISNHYHNIDEALPSLLVAKELEQLKWVDKIKALFLKNLPALIIETDAQKSNFGEWLYGGGAKRAVTGHEALGRILEKVKESHQKLHQAAISIQKTYRQIHPGLAGILESCLAEYRKWAANISISIIEEAEELDVELNPAESGLSKFLASDMAAAYLKSFPELKSALAGAIGLQKRVYDSAVEINDALNESEKIQAETKFIDYLLPAVEELSRHLQDAINAETSLIRGQKAAKRIYDTQIMPNLDQFMEIFKAAKAEADRLVNGNKEANRIYAYETLPALQGIQNLLQKIRTETKNSTTTDEVMLKAAQYTKRNLTLIALFAIIAGILIAFFIARGIINRLQRVSDQMNSSAGLVASGVGQVSSSSQSLAEGASEQAASIEETSSSLEEMSAMTRQNAENAQQADNLMREVNTVVGHANNSMLELISSMEQISKASEDTSKIIKAIDEIAFQTNLLALNAAVEAARAGEAGAGFAVVADEVRNLAMRAADAAQNTADLIEGTIIKVGDGSELVNRTDQAFSKVAQSASKVSALVTEISISSNEQAQGIEQVNKAVVEMDKVTQQNAANAEESASASEEMNAQTGLMKDMVAELVTLVGGKTKETAKSSSPKVFSKPTPPRLTDGKDSTVYRQNKAKPDMALAMDDEEFSDF